MFMLLQTLHDKLESIYVLSLPSSAFLKKPKTHLPHSLFVHHHLSVLKSPCSSFSIHWPISTKSDEVKVSQI